MRMPGRGLVLAGMPLTVRCLSFQFTDDAGQRLALRIAATCDVVTRTFSFPACPDNVCFLPGCMGRCGAGCGNETLPQQDGCSALKQLLQSTGAPRHNHSCSAACLNHDLCSFALSCPSAYEWASAPPTAPLRCSGRTWTAAARSYIASPAYDCPACQGEEEPGG